MRLYINLASQPYEDARQFWLRWGTGLVGTVILTVALLGFTVMGWFAARVDHATIASYRAEIAQRDGTRQQAQNFLNQPENRTTRDQSQFLNELIERKSLSWTHVLEDLEKVMPRRVHLVSIHPELDEDNQLKLKMVVGGDSRDRALELARRMEESRHFTQTHIETEHSAQSSSGDTIQFDINGIYVPSSELAPEAKRTETSKRSQP
ncbi:MAG TPA: PilN domain-containing protein [Candidatus Sulfotelmatobacter sp.]|jgi:Tfp pilus assembly protein PilN|nr:PilN domain-containing protein [Candidatus Sulfotelmatobacter sp.]